MPPAGDLAGLIAAIEEGFAALTAAMPAAGTPVDLAPVTAQIERVADAVIIGNTQVADVIGVDTAGDMRVRVNPEMP